VAVWPVQKRPSAFDLLTVPVLSGFKVIGMSPMNSAHRPFVQGCGSVCGGVPLFVWQAQSALLEHSALLCGPLKQRETAPVAAGDGH
jgi:hypothetical protein